MHCVSLWSSSTGFCLAQTFLLKMLFFVLVSPKWLFVCYKPFCCSFSTTTEKRKTIIYKREEEKDKRENCVSSSSPSSSTSLLSSFFHSTLFYFIFFSISFLDVFYYIYVVLVPTKACLNLQPTL